APRRARTNSRGLSWASVRRRSLRRRGRTLSTPASRQHIGDHARWPWHLRRSAQVVSCNAVSFARRRRGQCSTGTGGVRRCRRRRYHGDPASRAPDRGRAIPPGVGAHRVGTPHAGQLSEAVVSVILHGMNVSAQRTSLALLWSFAMLGMTGAVSAQAPVRTTRHSAAPRDSTRPKRAIVWPVVPVLPGALLPASRIVAYYGNPLSMGMGILGAIPPEQMLNKLAETAKEWQQADSTHVVRPALQLIATVAQGHKGVD